MLKKGDIVRDTSDDSSLYDKQGEVRRVYPNGAVIVSFPVFMVPPDLYRFDEERKPIRVTYKGEEVSDLVLQDHWDEEALTVWKAEELWPQFHHSVYFMKEPFKDGSECMVEGCENIALERGLVNVWGTVYPVDMCPEHLERWHGKAVEIGPELKPSKE